MAGSSLSLATGTRAADLPTGNIIAAGLYISNSSNVNGSSTSTVRFDEFSIVPEPGKTLLLSMGILGLLMIRRRPRD